MELRLSQFQGLLGWARKSWRYDPGVLDAFKNLSNEDHEAVSGSDAEETPGQDGSQNVIPMNPAG